MHDDAGSAVATAPDAERPHRETAGATPDVPPTTSTTVVGSRGWSLLALLSVIACAAANLYVIRGTRTPAFPYDEISMLQMSRMLGNQPTPDAISSLGYFPGWSAVMAPVWWFVSDPVTAYRIFLLLAVVATVLTIWPLSRILTRWGLGTAPSVVAAAFVMTLPVRAIQSDFTLSETLLGLLMACVVLAAYRLVERPTLLRHLVFAAAMGLLLFAHVRMTVAVVAGLIWLVLRLVRGPRIVTAVGIAALVVAGLVADKAGRVLNGRLLGRPFEQGDNLSDKVAASRPSLFVRVGLGQSWYQLLATYGLVLVGLVVVVVLIWWQVRRWRIGAEVLIGGLALSISLLSLAQWASDDLLFGTTWVRFDAWVYGRYIDPIAMVVTAIGAAVAIKGIGRATAAWSIGLGVVTAVAAGVLLTREVPTFGYVTPAHVPGLLPFSPLLPDVPWPRDEWVVPTLTGPNRVWIIAPLLALLVLVAVLVARSRPRLLASGLVVLAVVGTVVGARASTQFHEDEMGPRVLSDALVRLEPAADRPRVGFVTACGTDPALSKVTENYLGYAVLPSVVQRVPVDATTAPDLDVVVACPDWVGADTLGARVLTAVPDVNGSRIWVLPGRLQDRLAAAGRLGS